jgi:hypothetical protein
MTMAVRWTILLSERRRAALDAAITRGIADAPACRRTRPRQISAHRRWNVGRETKMSQIYLLYLQRFQYRGASTYPEPSTLARSSWCDAKLLKPTLAIR